MEITVSCVDNGWILEVWDEAINEKRTTVHLEGDDLLWEIVSRLDIPYDRFSGPAGKREKLVVAYVGEGEEF